MTGTRAEAMDAYEANVHAAIEALVAVLEDPELTYAKQREAFVEAIGWLEMDVTCGDCMEGRCHWGGGVTMSPLEACGCARHEVSVEAAGRHAAIEAWVIDDEEPLSLNGADG